MKAILIACAMFTGSLATVSRATQLVANFDDQPAGTELDVDGGISFLFNEKVQGSKGLLFISGADPNEFKMAPQLPVHIL